MEAAEPITKLLLDRGEALFRAPRQLVQFTHQPDADTLLNDLENSAHAFVLACIMDRQIKAEKAWLIPYLISERLKSFEFDRLAALSVDHVRRLMTDPTPLHRFSEEMSVNFHAGVQRISVDWNGDAAGIWHGSPSSAEVVYRFLQFRGVGPKIATMAANILARDFKIPMSDYHSIDISADVHVRRVFARLGLTGEEATTEEITYRARALHPAFPGLLDLPVWEIGREWCHPQRPACGDCCMHPVCPSSAKEVGV
jgi:endonuclease III